MNSSSPQISPASKHLAKELWTSLASLLNSHLTMRSLAQPAADLRIISDSETHIELKSYNRNLYVTAPDTSDSGTIQLDVPSKENEDESALFFFTADGLVHFEKLSGITRGEGMEMEAAVELLLDRMCR